MPDAPRWLAWLRPRAAAKPKLDLTRWPDRAALLADPDVLKVSQGRPQTRAMVFRKDHAWNIRTVEEAVKAVKRR